MLCGIKLAVGLVTFTSILLKRGKAVGNEVVDS
jgi:hypothetical protein